MKKKKLLKELKKTIRKDLGPRCKKYYWLCFSCQAWLAYDTLEDIFSEEENET